MKNVIIIDKNTNPLHQINENNNTKSVKNPILGGVFTEFGVRNRNQRVYTPEKFLPALNVLQEELNTLGVVFGEFDHPDVYDSSLQRASHVLQSFQYVPEKNRVEGKIKLLSTYWGREAQSILESDVPLFISSRAAGVTGNDGSVEIKKLFTYDLVASPGFASAKMESLNESCGFDNNASFRIYEISNESKINELITMNQNDLVTKQQFSEYSKYLVSQISEVKSQILEATKTGNIDPDKLQKLVEFHDALETDNAKLNDYLNYLTEKVSFLFTQNKELKQTTENLIKHNDHLVDAVQKNIDYSKYLAENLDNTIEYSQYIAENLDNTIEYSQYIAENLDNTIEYSQYIAENLDNTIEYSQYIAENLDNTIEYSQYIAENLDNTIEYSQYIAENLDNNITYGNYIAETLDKSFIYTKAIATKLNEKATKLNENVEISEDEKMPMPEDLGIEAQDAEVAIEEPTIEEPITNDLLVDQPTDVVLGEPAAEVEEPVATDVVIEEPAVSCEVVCDTDVVLGAETPSEETNVVTEPTDVAVETPTEDVVVTDGIGADEVSANDVVMNVEETPEGEVATQENENSDIPKYESTTKNLSEQIDALISEAKKRVVTETKDHNFLKFLNKSQVNSFYALPVDEQEQVTAYISEKKSYFTSADVLRLMNEALATNSESLEEKLIRLMPDAIKECWDVIGDKAKTTLLTQSKLFPANELATEQGIEHFWNTRDIKRYMPVNEGKVILAEEKYMQDDKLSDEAMAGIMSRLKKLN